MDALDSKTWHSSRFDVIVSNPPYISSKEASLMEPGVLDFEPHTALFAKNQGLNFYQYFAQNLPPLLSSGGTIILEISPFIHQQVVSILSEQGWSAIKVHKDYSDLERMVTATFD